MSLTNVNDKKRDAFTLVELVVSMTLAAIIIAATLGGFTFLGRNLTRLVNAQEQDGKSRRAFNLLGQDINAATALDSTSNDRSLLLTVPSLGTVSYLYDDQALTLSRSATLGATATTVLLSNLSSLSFKYYNQAGTLLSLASGGGVDLSKTGVQGVKEIELSFTSAAGNSAAGTKSVYAGRSPRFVLRNRPLLQ